MLYRPLNNGLKLLLILFNQLEHLWLNWKALKAIQWNTLRPRYLLNVATVVSDHKMKITFLNSFCGKYKTTMAGDFKYFDVPITTNCGYVYSCERAEEAVREFETRTTSKYSCYKSRSSFGKTGTWSLIIHVENWLYKYW
jgi:hypothetical protein